MGGGRRQRRVGRGREGPIGVGYVDVMVKVNVRWFYSVDN